MSSEPGEIYHIRDGIAAVSLSGNGYEVIPEVIENLGHKKII